jgi:hypothetical protein
MFLHQKELIQPVRVGKPDARFGTFLLEQFGGATGELTAALQYWVQSFHVENAGIRDIVNAGAKMHRRAGVRMHHGCCQEGTCGASTCISVIRRVGCLVCWLPGQRVGGACSA